MKKLLIPCTLLLVLLLAGCQMTTPQKPDKETTVPTQTQAQGTQTEEQTTLTDTQETQEQTEEQTTFGPLHFPETQE